MFLQPDCLCLHALAILWQNRIVYKGSSVSVAKILFCASYFLEEDKWHLLTGLSKPYPEQTNAGTFQLLEIEHESNLIVNILVLVFYHRAPPDLKKWKLVQEQLMWISIIITHSWQTQFRALPRQTLTKPNLIGDRRERLKIMTNNHIYYEEMDFKRWTLQELQIDISGWDGKL